MKTLMEEYFRFKKTVADPSNGDPQLAAMAFYAGSLSVFTIIMEAEQKENDPKKMGEIVKSLHHEILMSMEKISNGFLPAMVMKEESTNPENN